MAISFQLLFIIISGVIFLYLKERSFKYYFLYNLCLIFYVLSRSDFFYQSFENWIIYFLGTDGGITFSQIFNFYIQVIFYSFYTIFALYFLDLNKHVNKHFKRVIKILKVLNTAFLIFGVLCYFLKNSDLYINLYSFLFLPIMLYVFVASVIRAVKYSGKHKDYFLFGVCAFVLCALIAFVGTFIPSLRIANPISFFYVGIIFETLFFSLGLAYKIKLINDEKNRVQALVIQHKHQQQISKLRGLLEGEEKERKRIAEELHDGIVGDLSAIKFNLAFLNQKNEDSSNATLFGELSQIITKSCTQIREISHNLSPTAITNFGLSVAVENYCKKIEDTYHIKTNYIFSGDSLLLDNTSETHIYRIIQELLNNVVKHSEANLANVEIENRNPYINILVKDNGKGFLFSTHTKGIGLSNIDSRIRFLEGKIKKQSNKKGTSFHIQIDINKIHHFK